MLNEAVVNVLKKGMWDLATCGLSHHIQKRNRKPPELPFRGLSLVV